MSDGQSKPQPCNFKIHMSQVMAVLSGALAFKV